MTKYSKALWGIPCVVLFLLLQGVSAAQSGAENALLIHKPQSAPLTYDLQITTHSLLEVSWPRQPPITIDHEEDILTLSQEVTETDEGLLDVVLTVDAINPLPRGGERPEQTGPVFQAGDRYAREDIVGNSQHLVLNVLGEVKEATGLPHFSSLFYYARGLDAVAFDNYRVLLMLYPQFPLRLLEVGDSWSVEDEVTVTDADTGYLQVSLQMVVERTITYTLAGFVERKGYRTAHITFEAEYEFEASSFAASEEFFSDGTGEDAGEFYFAPEEGIVVEASITSKRVETKSHGGEMVRLQLDSETSRFVNLRGGHTTVPLKWYTDKTVSFQLAE